MPIPLFITRIDCFAHRLKTGGMAPQEFIHKSGLQAYELHGKRAVGLCNRSIHIRVFVAQMSRGASLNQDYVSTPRWRAS